MEQDSSGVGAPSGRDNLRAIKGIDGPAAKALEKIGIHRYSDLARYSPETLSETLKKKLDLSYPPETIRSKNWIKQSKMLVLKSERAAPPAPVDGKEGDGRVHKPPGKAWKQHASFTVFFDRAAGKNGKAEWQARVYHNESDEERPFGGLEELKWVEWIIRKAKLYERPAKVIFATAKTATLKIVKPENVLIAIERMEILEKQAAPRNTLQFKAGFVISGSQAADLLEERVRYRLEVILADAERDRSETVFTARGRLDPEKRAYTHLFERPMPEIGCHEVHCLVILLPPAELAAYKIGPKIRVEP